MNNSIYSRISNTLNNQPHFGLIISLLILLLIFFPIFYTDYAYLDEAHQLWNNKDNSNYTMFYVQGRWLSGILFNKFFSGLQGIAGLKTLRILSFFTWILFLKEFFRLGKIWQQQINLSKTLFTVSGVYIACSISAAIYIGWASCFEVGFATLLGMWCSNLLFTQMIAKKETINISAVHIFWALLSGLCSLFLYQTAFAAFLIPFAFYFIVKKTDASAKIVLYGIVAYLLIMIVYYLLFLLSLKLGSATASDRTNISGDVLGKLSFFFSAPLSQAFSFNFFLKLDSLISQAFPLVMIAAWLIAYFVTDKNKASKKMIFVVAFLGLCMFIYLPVLVSKENFASYRTMFVLNFVATVLLIDTIFQFSKSLKVKMMLTFVMLSVFTAVAYRNFRYNYISPLQYEYQSILTYFNKTYTKNVDTIYFLRPSENAFLKPFGVSSFNDEFGVPSTFKDWTPEPLIKQMIFEKTNNRSAAEKIRIIQFTERHQFEKATIRKTPGKLYIDPELLFEQGH